MLSHSAEVVVSEEDTELALLGGRRQLAQAVVGQLGRSGLQELLGDQACTGHKMGGGEGLA